MKFDEIDNGDVKTMWNLIGLMMKDVKFDGIDDNDMKFDNDDV